MPNMSTGKSTSPDKEPLSDLAFDWMTIIHHKSEALRAYQEYMRDAKSANSPECEALMRQIYEDDSRHVQEATQHLMKVLQGSMGQTGQTGQTPSGQTARTGQAGGRSGGPTSGS